MFNCRSNHQTANILDEMHRSSHLQFTEKPDYIIARIFLYASTPSEQRNGIYF